jgi:hypothetical protein
MTTLGRVGTPTAATRHRDPGLLHHTAHRAAPSVIPRLLPLCGQATTPITVARLCSKRRDAPQQSALFTTACRGSLTPVVGVKSAATNAHDLTPHHDRPGLLVVGDAGVSPRDSVAKKAVAFLTISRAMRRRVTA